MSLVGSCVWTIGAVWGSVRRCGVWGKYDAGGEFWELLDSSPFQFLLPAWCLQLEMCPPSFLLRCCASCLLPCLPVMKDYFPSGTESPHRCFWKSFLVMVCSHSYRKVTTIVARLIYKPQLMFWNILRPFICKIQYLIFSSFSIEVKYFHVKFFKTCYF